MIRSHRAPSKHRRAFAALAIALVLVAGAFSLALRPATPPALVDLQMPSGSVQELGQWCVDHNTYAYRQKLTTNGRNQLAGCVELYGKGLTPTPTSSPTPLPTSPSTPPPTTVPPTTAPPTTTPPATTTPPPTTPPATTPPATTPPATTAPPATTPPAPALVVGKDITAANTGYSAWVGPDGQRCTDATMTVYATRKNVTDFPVNTLKGRQITCAWFQGGLVVDADATLTATRLTGPTSGTDCTGGVYVACTWGPRLVVQWSVIDGSSFGCEIAVMGHVDLFRTQVGGCSDGVRFDGTSVVESYVRVRQLSSADHNDGVQAYMASQGGTILRSNVDSRPVNAPSVAGNAAIFIADNSKGEVVIRDNWLGGGGYTLRLHEAATYRVTGNVLSGWLFGPFTDDNAIPDAFLEWGDNRTDSGTVINL